jgi:hypothetical protein
MTREATPQEVTQTIVQNLAALLLDAADGNPDQAKDAASRAIEAFKPRTEAEFRLAARVTAYTLQATHALARANRPDTTDAAATRHCGTAMALTKEADKAEQRLAELQAGPPQEQDEIPSQHVPAAQPKSFPKSKDELRKIGIYAQQHRISFAQALRLHAYEPARPAAPPPNPVPKAA